MSRAERLLIKCALQSLPLLVGVEGMIGFLDLFVPLTGRMGADAPVDYIIAILVGALTLVALPMVRRGFVICGVRP